MLDFIISQCLFLCCLTLVANTQCFLLTLKASSQDHSHGPGLVPAHLWDSSELSVPGRCWGGDAHAAELPQLRPATARLYHHPQHTQRSDWYSFRIFTIPWKKSKLMINEGFIACHHSHVNCGQLIAPAFTVEEF